MISYTQTVVNKAAGSGKRTAATVAASDSVLRRRLRDLWERPSLLVILGVPLAIAGAAAVATLQNVLSPQYVVTVQQFEITPEAAKLVGVTGKGAADLVIDRLNRTATDASNFHGADYFAYDKQRTQPVALTEAMRIPVQSSYDIEVHGISVDAIVKAYRHLRYKEWLVSGDIVTDGAGYVVTIRLNRDDEAQAWEARSPAPTEVAERVQSATDAMLEEKSPELFGSAALKQALNASGASKQEAVASATKIFQRWAMRDSTNWKPYYYLSLAYDANDAAREAANLVQWSERVKEHEGEARPGKRLSSMNGENPATLAPVMRAVWATRGQAAVETMPAPERQAELQRIGPVEKTLQSLCAGKDATLTSRLQLARVLAREAELEASLSRSPTDDAYAKQERAVALLAGAVEEMPRNGGLHEQHAVLEQHLVAMGTAMGKDRLTVELQEQDEVNEYTRALELAPQKISPLWGAVYGLIQLHREQEAVDLSRTMTLLRPDSTQVHTAYILALEHARSSSGRSAETEAEAEIAAHLQPFLHAANNEDELLTLWGICTDQRDSESSLKIADALSL